MTSVSAGELVTGDVILETDEQGVTRQFTVSDHGRNCGVSKCHVSVTRGSHTYLWCYDRGQSVSILPRLVTAASKLSHQSDAILTREPEKIVEIELPGMWELADFT